MKGYFSKLAQSSGLNFESGKSSAERGGLPLSTRMTARKLAPAPIHVEEFVLSEPAPAIASNPSQNVTSPESIDTKPVATLLSPVANNVHQDSVPSTDERTIEQVESLTSPDELRIPAPVTKQPTESIEEIRIQYTSTESRKATSRYLETTTPEVGRESSRLVHEPVSHTEFGSADRRRVEQTAELLTEISDKTEGLEPQLVSLDHVEQSLEPRTSNLAREQANKSEPERPTLQHYLSEIRAWMTSDSETITTETDERLALEPGSKHHSEESTRTREMSTSSPVSAKQPEQQDLSLSIGTISIVIEEPNPPAAASPLPAPPAVGSTTHETAREPTSLSRYYLRTW
jgi:hypothetical protein